MSNFLSNIYIFRANRVKYKMTYLANFATNAVICNANLNCLFARFLFVPEAANWTGYKLIYAMGRRWVFSCKYLNKVRAFDHIERFSTECRSNSAIALVLHCCALWLVKKYRATTSTNQKQNQNPSRLACARFPALGTGDMYLLRALIGSLDCLRLLWLVRVITLVLILRHSIKNRSNVVVVVIYYRHL